jgi:methylated-DNA-[protein]-cysteine S-methyltransferase
LTGSEIRQPKAAHLGEYRDDPCRNDGLNAMFYLERIDTPTGHMLLVTDEALRLRAADWEDHTERMIRLLRLHYGDDNFSLRAAQRRSPARRSVEAYFEGDFTALNDVVTVTMGTEFQRQVWAALRRIPVGSTLSYGTLAAQVGRPSAVRAVGAANGSNPIPVVVPCHRVIGADGALTGFGGGLQRKRWLLNHESGAAGRH